jgi:DNA-binding NarL/FixJ family response regulator
MLTKKELQVMKLLVEGKLNKEIAEEIGVSIYTIKNHLKNIYKKWNVRNRSEAIIKAQHQNIFFKKMTIENNS